MHKEQSRILAFLGKRQELLPPEDMSSLLTRELFYS